MNYFKKLSIKSVLIVIYVLTVLGLSATARANQSLLPFPKASQLQTFVGAVVFDEYAQPFLVSSSEGKVFQLFVRNSVAHLAGVLVEVKGIEVKRNQDQRGTITMLPDNRSSQTMNVILVSEINERIQ